MKKRLLSSFIYEQRILLKKLLIFFIKRIFRSKSYAFFGIPYKTISLQPQHRFPKETLTYSFPKTLYEISEPFLSHVKKEHFQEGILCVSNGLTTNNGGNLQRGMLISTYLQCLDNQPEKHDLLKLNGNRLFPRIYRMEGRIATLSSKWQGAFYHWFHEILPRIDLLKKASIPIDAFYVDTRFAFQKETLKLLGIESIIDASSFKTIQAKELVIPSICSSPNVRSCEYLRKQFLPFLSQSQKPKRRLFISRKDAKRRRILNEEEVKEVLSVYGFESIEMCSRPLLEQMELFRDAEIIIAPHGAALTHLVFCSPGTKLLEIFAPDYVNLCYWTISNAVKINYAYLLGETKKHLSDIKDSDDPDFTVDTAQLKKTLLLMEI